MAEYRLDDLAKVSGVKARNIRNYRERGLLDPPRRVGREAYYDDLHVSQLKTIDQLLRRGFRFAHIAAFLEAIRRGSDLMTLDEMRLSIAEKEKAHAEFETWLVDAEVTLAALRAMDIPSQREEIQRLVAEVQHRRFVCDQIAGGIDEMRQLLARIEEIRPE